MSDNTNDIQPTPKKCATCESWDGRYNPVDSEGRAMCAVDTTEYLTLGVFRTKPTFGCNLYSPASAVERTR